MTVRYHALLVAFLATIVAVPHGVSAAAGEPAVTQGLPWTGSVGVARSVAQIRSATGPRTGQPIEPGMSEREHEWPDRSSLPQAPGAEDVSQWPPAEDASGLSTTGLGMIAAGPQTPSTSFVGATLAGAHPTFSFPPDGMGAVGPTQYVVFVNGRLVSYDKATGAADGVLDDDPDAFFGPVNNGTFTTDPRIRYDRLSGRWFLIIVNTSTPNWVLIAVSDAASNGVISPSTVFTLFWFPIDTPPPAISATCFADYPTLGIDANALYIGVSNFCGSPTQTFNSNDGFVVRKSSILGAGPLVVTALRGLVPNPASDGPYVPQGVDNFDPAATEGYFIGVSNTVFSRLVLRRVGTPGGTPTVSANILITVPTTYYPLKVPHLGNTGGTNGGLSGVDDRLFAPHLRNGRLWTAHNMAVTNTGVASATGSRNGSRWYELQGIASPSVPSIVQSGTVFTASGANTTDQPHFWMPSVMVSGQGHALMGFSTAGSLIRADGAATGRLAGDVLGTMAAPSAYTFSFAAYNPPSDPGSPSQGRRWGDYSYTSLDPIDDMTMWTIQEFCDATNSYACQVIKMLAPPPATPTSVADVNAGAASESRVVTAASVSGSGFYDPGPDLGGGVPAFNHLTATITNAGVTGTPPTVNSVTYVDPTHVQLDINSTAATISLAGEKYTVVITNPDGRTASGAILRVNGTVGVGDGSAVDLALSPVWPNPAGRTAEAYFSLPREAPVRVTVVDLEGREIHTLAEGTTPAGRHHVVWDGSAGLGSAPAGIYFMRYQTPGTELVRRFVRLH